MMGRRRIQSAPQWTRVLLLTLSILGQTQGDYLMGGHLDNTDQDSPVISRRSDTPSISSRSPASLDDLDRDFDLGLDLLAEHSSVDSSRSGSSPIGSTATGSEEPEVAPRYRVPLVPYAFNGGQPFSLEKDPITGQIDFEKAPPLKVLEYSAKSPEEEDPVPSESLEDEETLIDQEPKSQLDEGLGPNEINPYSPSFHDFLNLPVRYTYDKYEHSEKYPLISSSYANTKVQSGTNSYNTYNHKKYHESVKASVDIHMQPPRKQTHIQSVARTTTRSPPTEASTEISTTAKPTTSTRAPTTTTTTTPPPTTTTSPTTTTRRTTTFLPITTWKPQRVVPDRYSGEDYEGSLPIERFQADSEKKKTGESPFGSQSSKPVKPQEHSEEYEDTYDEYDRVYHRPTSSESENNSEGDYSYGLDFFGVGSRPSMRPPVSSTEEQVATSTVPTTTSQATTRKTIPSIATSQLPPKEDFPSTTSKPEEKEEKRVTSMPLDSSDHYIGGYGNGGQGHQGTIDNSIPSVTSNVVYHQLRPSGDQFYRPSGPGIVVKSTSNVVVPPGQDTVSFVLGNRQSVGSSDTPGEYYPVHSGSVADSTGVAYGKIGNSRPMNNMDNYPGQMIVSAGIGVGPTGSGSYSQRPQSGGNQPFDHALVSVGMPTVDVVNPGEVQSGSDKIQEGSTTKRVDPVGPNWWGPGSNSKPQSPLQVQQSVQNPQSPQQDGNSHGYHVTFPDQPSSVSTKDKNQVEEHVIVVHESDLGASNTLHLDLASQTTTNNPSTNFVFETSTQRFPNKQEEHLLPELSESLTPPIERPNRVQGHRPPNYNYYHHQPHSSPNNQRPEFPRPQRVPLPPPPPPSSSGSSSSSSPPGFKRRPGPPLDSNLPNILPQFRPNAKVSHGHNRGDNIGTISAGSLGHYGNPIVRRPPHHHMHRPSPSRRPAGPPHLQRLNPPPLPPPPPPITSLRLPTPAALIRPTPNMEDSQGQNSENSRLTVQKRVHQVFLGAPPALNLDERRQSVQHGVGFNPQQGQQIKSRLEDENLERFAAEPPQQPPRPPFFVKRNPASGSGKQDGVPRIATLQMIQQHGGDDSVVKSSLPPPFRFNLDDRQPNRNEADDKKDGGEANNANRREDEIRKDASGENLPWEDNTRGADFADTADAPVYVVYPVKGAMDIRPTSHEDDEEAEDASVVLGKYGAQRPLPPGTLLKDSGEESSTDEYHAYRPTVGSPTESQPPQLASDFPYPLERPDPSLFTSQLREKPLLVPSDQEKNAQSEEKPENGESGAHHEEDRDASVNVIPYPQDHIPFGLTEHSGPISATLHRLDSFSSKTESPSTPMAYVYPPMRRPEDGGYAHKNFERTQVVLQSQHTSTTDSGPGAPQSFMAPFVASASAEAPSRNGWSVVKLEKSPNEETMDRRKGDAEVLSEDKEKEGGEKEKESGKEEKEEKKKSEQEEKKEESTESQTEKSEFNLENFTPQLFGGFKPIFEFPSDMDTDPSLGDKVSGGALAIERPRSGTGGAKLEMRKLESV